MAYAYVAPATVLLLVFGVLPLAVSLWISLWKWGIFPERFIGMANYQEILESGLVVVDAAGNTQAGPVGQALANTLYYVALTLLGTIGPSFLVAYLLFRIRTLRDVLQTVYFMPFATTAVAAALVFAWIFNSHFGIANGVLTALGLPEQQWLLDPTPVGRPLADALTGGHAERIPTALQGPSLALCVVILFNVWNVLGFAVAIYLSGLAGMPAELLDAAEVDGASSLQRFRHIVVPLMRPTTLFLTIYLTVSAFKAFTPVFALTQGGDGQREAGGPLGSTNMLTIEIFNNFYQRSDRVGYACAVAVILLIAVGALSALQFRVFRERP
ncbi:hypothetical protein GCM10028789_04600 [Sinomonas halotolerans]